MGLNACSGVVQGPKGLPISGDSKGGIELYRWVKVSLLGGLEGQGDLVSRFKMVLGIIGVFFVL